MPPVINNLALTTELEAVNAMLSAAGESPLAPNTDLSTATHADVEMAIAILRGTTREVLSMGWKFNTEFGYEVEPSDTYDWIGSDSVTTPLNIFVPPAGMIGFTVTKIPEQQGSRVVDTEIRPSRRYTSTPSGDLVFYDRTKARDGFPQSERDFLYINPKWLFDFETLPEVARRYITMVSARRLIEDGVGSATLSQFHQRDESIALRNLKREQGEEDDYTLFQSADVLRVLGRRPGGWRGTIEGRKNRG